MGKNDLYSPSSIGSNKKEIHPIWRGIGFIFLILIPILSYVGALTLLEENGKRGWFGIPRELLVPIFDPYLGVKIGIAVVLMVILYGLYTLLSFIVFSIAAPPRYGPFDVPPQRYRGNKKPR
jgi:quinol-cytochrome oxidoreductase complex cytochrome b subunit